MLKYLLKRILVFIPTLLLISLLAFGLSKIPNGDPIQNCYDPGGEIESEFGYNYADKIYSERAATLGTNKPNFYFSLSAQAYPDTLFRVVRKSHRLNIENLIAQYGNWAEIQDYVKQIRLTEIALLGISTPSQQDNKIDALREIRQLPTAYEDNAIMSRLKRLEEATQKDSIIFSEMGGEITLLTERYNAVKQNATTSKLYTPDFKWYGLDNQYHNWITGFLVGDFGVACDDKRPVGTKIKEAIFWTLIMNFIALFLTYLIAIPLGVWSATKKGTRADKITTMILFILYSLPVFWIGIMALIFFATPDYGMQIFPGIGLGDLNKNASLSARFWERLTHLILPIMCMVYPTLAFLSRQMRGGMLDVLKQDYIRTARAKGLPENKVIWKHAFRNSLFPIITILASIFPRILAGSIVIEVIFNIPGMGNLFFNSIYTQDWNVVFTVLMLGAVMTMIGILVADLLYAKADPRVSLG